MRILIVEDDYTSRKLMQKLLCAYGETDGVGNGEEALEAFRLAFDENRPYSLICLDIMMPGIDGQQVLKSIRALEKVRGVAPKEEVKIIMTTALDSPKDVIEAYYQGGCSSYLVKPIEKKQLVDKLKELGLVS